MNIFGGLSREDLVKKIERLEEALTISRNEEANAKILLGRQQTTHRMEIANINSAHTIEVNNLKNKVEELESSYDDDLENEISEIRANCLKELESDKASYRKYLKTEMNGRVEVLEKENKALQVDSGKFKGLYDGTLLVVKTLETQLASANKLTTTLIDALPEVKANLNAGNQNVSVNAKS